MGSTEFQRENDELVYEFLKKGFMRGMREGIPNWDRIEFFVDARCNLDCKYCYLAKYGDELYPRNIRDDKKILRNAEILLDWLVENELAPTIEIFSGEPSIHPAFYELVPLINEKYSGIHKKPSSIVVPTNYSFLLSEKLTEMIEDMIRESKIPVILSASVDGKYCEQNRPFRTHPKHDPRDDSFYEKMFAFNKKHRFGFHPMVYSERIEYWKRNFLWFQENFRRYSIPFWNIYLLEVRNPEWKPHQIYEFGKFIKFLVYYTFYVVLNSDERKFIEFLFKHKGYNILSAPLTMCGRGIGCSIQSTLTVRLGDLAWVPCHRLSYGQFELAKFIVKDGKISGLTVRNPELLFAIFSLDARNLPYCEACAIKDLCSKGCLGAQYEFTGDMFTLFPTLCMLEHTKIYALIEALKGIGVYEKVLSYIAEEKRNAFYSFEKYIMREKGGRV